jgi:hypothetical protein
MAEKISTPSSATSETKEIYLTPQELSERFKGITLKTISNWRNDSSGKRNGPPFLKAGGRVLYPLSHLQAWEAARLRTSGANEPTHPA